MLYDEKGRPVLVVYVQGVTFAGATHFRIYAGRPQVLNDTDGQWYDLRLQNDPNSGIPSFGVGDTAYPP